MKNKEESKTEKQKAIIKKIVGNVSLDKLLPQADGKVFCLVRMAMVRALEIHLGSPALVEHETDAKETSIALEEIAQGLVSIQKRK